MATPPQPASPITLLPQDPLLLARSPMLPVGALPAGAAGSQIGTGTANVSALRVLDARAMMRAHESRSRLIWYRALQNPAYQRKAGRVNSGATTGITQWLYELQTGVDPFARAMVSGAQRLRRITNDGQIDASDIVISSMPDEYPLSDHDLIVPIGDMNGPDGLPAARVFTRTDDAIVRGGVETSGGDGRITSAGAVVTGIGTAFWSSVRSGDVLKASGREWIVESVADDTHLTLTSAPSPALTGVPFSIGVDKLIVPHAVRLVVLMLDDGTAITPHSAGAPAYIPFDAAPPATAVSEVRWTPAGSPPPGTQYSVRYDYLPRYQVKSSDLGLRRLPDTVTGAALPQRVVAKLWLPTTDARGAATGM